MTHPARYLTEDSSLAEEVVGWRDAGIIGLDTEFIRTRTFYPIAALYQVEKVGTHVQHAWAPR